MRKNREPLPVTALPLADFGYDFGPLDAAPTEVIHTDHLGPSITAAQMRELGEETIKEMQDRMDEESKPAGRHAADRVSYEDAWAKRYWRSQAGIERGRLDKGMARHRAHREPFAVEPPKDAA
ncbi:hypothetical protein PBI_PEAS_40 [Arthrobacter phage Peas]|uniref:Uncharacterized protein n=1 Tax=Arthrobacter phage Peas TaxID=2419965 RepID=A0A3G2KIE3_9CAUD|nr:hypothetical protein HOU51_gp40 [Arthrobacter phage Peas]AYN58727.1 hypothetical protein PBI_PEAS_40 [Arthrobacter phage Peas]